MLAGGSESSPWLPARRMRWSAGSTCRPASNPKELDPASSVSKLQVSAARRKRCHSKREEAAQSHSDRANWMCRYVLSDTNDQYCARRAARNGKSAAKFKYFSPVCVFFCVESSELTVRGSPGGLLSLQPLSLRSSRAITWT